MKTIDTVFGTPCQRYILATNVSLGMAIWSVLKYIQLKTFSFFNLNFSSLIIIYILSLI